MTLTRRARTVRDHAGANRVTNVELFFDLVYVFAVTQISHVLVENTTATGVLHAAILLALVWQVWAYTTWMSNYLEPDRMVVRLTLIGVMLGSLVLAGGLPEAFGGHGLLIAATYVAIQVGRTLIAIVALRGETLQMVFVRILPWLALSGVAVIAGGLVSEDHVHVRELLWLVAIVVDLIGAGAGFWFPGLDRSATTDWTISGGLFAERCQAFVLIALGESVVVIGSQLKLDDPSRHDLLAFAAAFLGAVALWWIYFDRAAEDGSRAIESSDDPGRLGRNAFHFAHPLIIGGIIVTAAADEKLLEHPFAHGTTAANWLVLGGTALFLAGHALFKQLVFRRVSWPRVIGAVVLLALGTLAPHAAILPLGVAALAVVVVIAVLDRLQHPTPVAA
jgi:low temperature requirement protein LtrA